MGLVPTRPPDIRRTKCKWRESSPFATLGREMRSRLRTAVAIKTRRPDKQSRGSSGQSSDIPSRYANCHSVFFCLSITSWQLLVSHLLQSNPKQKGGTTESWVWETSWSFASRLSHIKRNTSPNPFRVHSNVQLQQTLCLTVDYDDVVQSTVTC